MPIKRDADGNIVEEKTEYADSFGREARPEDRTVLMQPAGGRQPAQPAIDAGPHANSSQQSGPQSGYEARTVLAKSKPAGGPGARGSGTGSRPAPDHRTRIYRPGARKSQPSDQPPEQQSGQAEAAGRPTAADAMDDPPVGWLVVVQGPGQGNAVTIGNGSNSLGRDHSERICVDFGDETISRRGHTTITYDPRGKKFYIQHGGGKNLTYMEDSPVLVPTELQGFSKIQIGETVLLFVPLCGERFDWAEYEQ